MLFFFKHCMAVSAAWAIKRGRLHSVQLASSFRHGFFYKTLTVPLRHHRASFGSTHSAGGAWVYSLSPVTPLQLQQVCAAALFF